MSYVNRTPRMQREYISFKDKFYHLHEVKDIFERNIHNFSSINLNFFLNNENTKNIFEKEAFYLHFLIIFRTPIDVFNYLNSKRVKEELKSRLKLESIQVENGDKMAEIIADLNLFLWNSEGH